MVQSVMRTLRIMEALAENGETGVSDLGRTLDLSVSTVHRLLNTLVEKGYATQNPNTGKYRLGIKVYSLGSAMSEQSILSEAARSTMQELWEYSKETVNLAVLDGPNILYIDKLESPQALKIGPKVGSHIPSYCSALGRAILSQLSAADLDQVLAQQQPFPKQTENTLTDLHEIKKRVLQVRQVGYAINNEEMFPGTRCVAAPIFEYSGQVAGAMSVAGPSIRMSMHRCRELGEQIRNAGRTVSETLGYTA